LSAHAFLGLKGVVRIALARFGCTARSSTLLEEDFFSSLTSIIGYLRRQITFVADMNAEFPRVVTTRWTSSGKASAWLV
jgi:hypothetical protein